MSSQTSPLLFVLIVSAPLVVLPAGYFVWLWYIRRAPRPGSRAIVPQYEPPPGITPAEVGVLLERALHPRVLSALILDLSLRGAIEVTEAGGKAVSLRRTVVAAGPLPAPYERFLLDRLFAGGLTVDVPTAAAAVRNCQKELYRLIRYSLLEKKLLAERKMQAVIVLASAVIGGLILGAGMLVAAGLLAGIGTAAVVVFMGQLAYAWLISPDLSDQGRQMLADIEGFRMYLGAVEGNRIKWEELEENNVNRYTPYAIVFDISVTWSTRLQSISKALLENILI